uniref:LRRNT_2 domain-containing protein n=1 Tax=Steinernema glaseri TaxID=37863 RepID=A0A1I7ZRK6_9BILA
MAVIGYIRLNATNSTVVVNMIGSVKVCFLLLLLVIASEARFTEVSLPVMKFTVNRAERPKRDWASQVDPGWSGLRCKDRNDFTLGCLLLK